MATETRARRRDASKSRGCLAVVPQCFRWLWSFYYDRDCRLSPTQLRRLKEHKYSAQDASWLDELCMKTFWEWCVEKYPEWLAPNLITLVGLVVNVFASVLLAYFSADGKTAAPWWTYLLCAVGLFFYQTLDATDGKQARRTNSASPLGELFDHGCDSLSQVFVSVEMSLAMLLGRVDNALFYFCMYAVIVFYCAHWQTYCTGTLIFSKFDVTEAQMCVIALCSFTALVGPEFWMRQLFGFQLNHVFLIVTTVIASVQSSSYVRSVLSGGVGKNGSTVADTSVLFPLFPLLAAVAPMVMIWCKSDSGVFVDNAVLFCVWTGVVTSKMTNRLIIAHMSKTPFDLWDSIFVSPLLMMFNQYCNTFLDEYYMLLCCTALAMGNLLLNSVCVCRQLCDHLHISCFRIR